MDIGLGFDPARGRAHGIGEDWVRHDLALLASFGPNGLREGEVGGVVTVEVTDLPAPELEGELAAAARTPSGPARVAAAIRDRCYGG